MIGLTLGSLACFAIGRWLGVHFVRKLVNARVWQRIGFIVESEGAIICAVIFAIPGLPKDITCYLFGVSTIPFWVFAVVSTIARAPHTWVLSKQGAQAASGDYLELVRSEEHTSELQSLRHLVCRLLLEKKKKKVT